MSAIQQFLSTLVTNARKPGAMKSIVGQLAIAYGSNMVMETAAAAEERTEQANEVLAGLQEAIAVERQTLRKVRDVVDAVTLNKVRAAILAGDLDAEVRDRAEQLGYVHRLVGPKPPVDAELVDDGGPPETIGAVRDLPGDEPVPPCARRADCVLEYRHPGACRPTVPPNMAGLLAGDGSDDRPYRTVDTIASVLDDPADDDGDRD